MEDFTFLISRSFYVNSMSSIVIIKIKKKHLTYSYKMSITFHIYTINNAVVKTTCMKTKENSSETYFGVEMYQINTYFEVWFNFMPIFIFTDSSHHYFHHFFKLIFFIHIISIYDDQKKK